MARSVNEGLAPVFQPPRAGGRGRRKAQRRALESPRHRGRLYLCDAVSAVLEMLVHVDSDLLPLDLMALSAEFSSNLTVRTVAEEELPRDWRVYPAPESTQALGTAWAHSGDTAVLSVPSVVVPNERNYLLNSAHPDFSKITWSAPRPFHWDARLLS